MNKRKNRNKRRKKERKKRKKEYKLCASIVDQIELDVASSSQLLPLFLLFGELVVLVLRHCYVSKRRE